MPKKPEDEDDTFFRDLSKRLTEIGEDDEEAESEIGPEEGVAREEGETPPEEPDPTPVEEPDPTPPESA
jgi:hypothetical protein